jgi:hypothetical protein
MAGLVGGAFCVDVPDSRKDLWPDDPLEVGVRKMFKVRNDFVHTGYIDMTGRAYIPARRAHVLGERLIWQILGGQRQWEDVRSSPRTDDLRVILRGSWNASKQRRIRGEGHALRSLPALLVIARTPSDAAPHPWEMAKQVRDMRPRQRTKAQR